MGSNLFKVSFRRELGYYLITFAISPWVILIERSGLKYITFLPSDGKVNQSLMICFAIIISEKHLLAKQRCTLKRSYLLHVLSLKKTVQGHRVKGKNAGHGWEYFYILFLKSFFIEHTSYLQALKALDHGF